MAGDCKRISSGIRLPSSAMSVWVSCGPGDVVEAESGMEILLGLRACATAGESRRRWRDADSPGAALDRALLVEGLQVADRLRDDADQLAHHLAHVLLGELALHPPRRLAAERRQMLRPSGLAGVPAEHGSGLQRSLALQRADDLRHDRQDLPHHFVDVLL